MASLLERKLIYSRYHRLLKKHSAMGFSFLRMLLLLAVAELASGFSEGLLRNGNFEQGPNWWQLNGTRIMGRNAIPEWETTGFVEYIPSGQKQGDMLLVVPEGFYAVRLGNGASVRQRVELDEGKRYSVTFSAARTCAQNEQLNVSVGARSGLLPVQTMYSSNGWDSYAWAWKADAPDADVVIHHPGDSEDPACGPIVDSVAMKVIQPPRATNTNILKNGDFEEGPYIIPGTKWGVLIPPHGEDKNSPLPGWIVESLKAVKYIDSPHFSVPKGSRAVELVGGMEGAVSQIARTVPGKSYALSFSVGDASNSCEGSLAIQAYAARATIRVSYTSKGTGGSTRAVLRFKAVSARTRVVFLSTMYSMRSDDMSSLCGPVLDDVVLVGIRSKH